MAVRNESVRLTLEDRFSSKMARAAAAAALLNAELERLNGRQVSNDFDGISTSVDKTGSSTRRAGPDIDKFSGRLRLLADAALIVGPALAPLGALAVGGIVTMSAQAGALAGALGVTVLAVAGLGDGLDALNAYQLDPTAENLAKMREELDRLGPSGEHFVRFLDSIEPELKSLQLAARDGLLPGAEEGIDSLLKRLPQIRTLIEDTAGTLGNISADAGDALAGEQFDAFFRMLQNDGIPILDDTSRTIGNLTQAAANLFVAFSPLSTDLSGGLLEWSEGLADASRDLESNPGFQEFVAYIRETGPEVVDTLTSLANAALQIVEATAPLGGPVLAGVKAFADSVAIIADSDIGTPIFAALAALALYNRAAKTTATLNSTTWGGKALGSMKGYATGLLAVTSAQERAQMTATEMNLATQKQAGSMLKAGAGTAGLALTMSGLADNTGLANTAMLSMLGPWGTAAGLALDLMHATDGLEDSIVTMNAAMRSTDASQVVAALDAANTEIERTQANTILGTSIFGDTIGGVSNALAPLSNVSKTMGALTGETEEAGKAAQELQQHLDDLRNGSARSIGTIGDFASILSESAAAAAEEKQGLEDATAAMRAHRSEALRSLNAELNYQAAIDDANKGLKENGRNFDITTEKGRANRQLLYALADGWNQQSDAAKNASGSLNTARQNFIEVATSMGATTAQAKRLADSLFEIKPRTVSVTVNTGDAAARIQGIAAGLFGLHDKTITVTVNQRGGVTSSAGGHSVDVPGGADGMTVPGKRLPYGDKLLAYLAPGEEVISNRYGQADRFRADRASGRIPGYADGGSAGGRGGSSNPGGGALFVLGDAANGASRGLKGLERELKKSESALEKERSKLESLTSSRDSLSSSASSSLLHDPFGNGLAGFDAQIQADTADSQAMLAALQTLVRNGLDPKGSLFQALAASGDVTTAQQMATLTSQQLFAEQSAFSQAQGAAGQVGQFAGTQAFGQAIAEQRDATKELRAEVKHLRHAVDRMGDRVEKGAEKGSHKGTKDANEGRQQQFATRSRTGAR